MDGNLGLGGVCNMNVGIFDLEHACQGHLGSFGAFFRKLCRNSKTAHRRAKRMKIWAPGVYVTCMLVFKVIIIRPLDLVPRGNFVC